MSAIDDFMQTVETELRAHQAVVAQAVVTKKVPALLGANTLAAIRTAADALVAEAQREAREIFVPVKGFEGLYEVSNTGKVRSIARGRNTGRELVQSTRVGYKVVSLCKPGVAKTRTVHRIVAEAFISNPENKRTVNHKDSDKANNDVTNLEWATYSENERHAHANGKVVWNKGATHCKYGHELSTENTYIQPSGGWRECRTCRAGRKRSRAGELLEGWK